MKKESLMEMASSRLSKEAIQKLIEKFPGLEAGDHSVFLRFRNENGEEVQRHWETLGDIKEIETDIAKFRKEKNLE